MKETLLRYWDVFLDALVDSLKILPVLLIAYFLIEFIEYKYAMKLQNNHLLKGKSGPVIGSLLGTIPQCGFSVVSTDLFSRGVLSVGTLLAVFIATSDEALPIMIGHPESYKALIILIVSKIIIAIIVGYLANGLFKLMFRQKNVAQQLESATGGTSVEKVEKAELNAKSKANSMTVENVHGDVENHEYEEEHETNVGQDKELLHAGCCHHHVDSKKFDWVHPLLHCLKIFGFIFAISFIFGCITEIWIGEDRLIAFLNSSVYLQPLLSVIIGLIPNCVSSVILTEFYLIGGLRFSSLLAGLMVNAGLGIIFLIKQNKNVKVNIFIISMLILSALVIGYAFIWLTL